MNSYLRLVLLIIIGYFCPPGQSDPTPFPCLEGHECPEGSGNQIPCSSGFYQPNPTQGDCLVCPAGSYCDQDEAIAEQQSGAGKWMLAKKYNFMKPCLHFE